MSDILIETHGLKKYFKTPRGLLHAVDNVNIRINRGQTLGVVGESGCGKSTLGRVLLRLLDSTEGEILFEGKDVVKFNKHEMAEYRKEAQMIFQDPYSSINPRMTVSQTIAEPMEHFKTIPNRIDREDRVYELMETVGLAERFVNAFPHELDGGRRQRIGVARALALDPKFIVCDEPVSALDVSIQAQILNLLMDLQDEKKLTYMFITHDLSVVKHISDEIAVLYLGECVEKAPSNELFLHPEHPYTKALLKAIPVPSIHHKMSDDDIIKGEVTSPVNPKPGCRFAARCPYVKPECMDHQLQLKEISKDHFVACTLFE
jgi:peptide/nickel transport system ATP-binding protein